MSGRWDEAAACRGAGADLFFAPDDDSPTGHRYTQARRICARCPVRTACLEAAMDREGSSSQHSRGGMWGGLSPGERESLHHARQAAAAEQQAAA